MQQAPDDWKAMGFDHAIMAETNTTLEGNDMTMQQVGWTRPFTASLQQTGDTELTRKTNLYKSSIEL